MVQSSKEIPGGKPVFRGTRVPISTLIEYLQAGDRLDDFLRDYPPVTRKQAIGVLQLAKQDIAKG